MAIEQKWWRQNPSLSTQSCIRNIDELRHQIDLVEHDITEILKQITPNDFTQIKQNLNSCIVLCQTEQRKALKEYNRVKKQLHQLQPKLLIGDAYYHPNYPEILIKPPSINVKKRRKRLKLPIEQQWRKGIGDAYRKLQIQRDQQEFLSYQNPSVNNSIPIEPLPIIHNDPLDEPPPLIITENTINQIKENEFIAPLPPTPIDEIIVPFQTPPIPSRLTPTDQTNLAIDDTIVKPHRLINKTLANITHMSFNIEPDQCSSPKPEEKKKKAKLKKLMLPPAPPPPPQFSSTAIFDTHAFFTQTSTKTKKQKKKIDIARQPVIMAINDKPKKKGRTKKCSPYDFQDDDINQSSRSKATKLLTDDIITARFAKNSHYQTHQSSMASIKSQRKSNKQDRKKKKKNILGIGTSSPLITSTNLTLSPGRLSISDEDFSLKSSSKTHNQTTKSKRKTRVK